MVAEQKEILKSLAIKLHEIDAIKFGTFQTKSGMESPIYFDLRVIISYPEVMVNFTHSPLFGFNIKSLQFILFQIGNANKCAAKLCVRTENRIQTNLWRSIYGTANRYIAFS